MKAAMLKTPEGIEFVAFFDIDGKIPSQESAIQFLHAIKLLTPNPSMVLWREAGKWKHLGNTKECVEYIRGVSEESLSAVLLTSPVLMIPGKPQTPEKAWI